MIDSSLLGIEGTADMIAELVKGSLKIWSERYGTPKLQ